LSLYLHIAGDYDRVLENTFGILVFIFWDFGILSENPIGKYRLPSNNTYAVLASVIIGMKVALFLRCTVHVVSGEFVPESGCSAIILVASD